MGGGGTLDGAAPHVGDGDESEDGAHDERAGTDGNAVAPVDEGEGLGLEDVAAKLDDEGLDDGGDGDDGNENPVGVEAAEHVPLVLADLPGVDFVEHLQSHATVSN